MGHVTGEYTRSAERAILVADDVRFRRTSESLALLTRNVCMLLESQSNIHLFVTRSKSVFSQDRSSVLGDSEITDMYTSILREKISYEV